MPIYVNPIYMYIVIDDRKIHECPLIEKKLFATWHLMFNILNI